MKNALHIVIAMMFSVLACRGAESPCLVATVDGSPITKEEFSFALAPYTASLYSLRGSGSPAAGDSLRRIVAMVLERSIETKVQQLLAKEHALVADVCYDAFRAGFLRENAARLAAYERGEVVYGPIEFTELAFFDYQLSNTLADLKRLLAAQMTEGAPSRIRMVHETETQGHAAYHEGLPENMRARSVDEAFAESLRIRRARARVTVNEEVLRDILREYQKRGS